MSNFKILATDGLARRGEFDTVHGKVQTPVFQNVGTIAAIKGALSTEDLRGLGTQIELSNTYHLHLRPGDEVVKKLGGLPGKTLKKLLLSGELGSFLRGIKFAICWGLSIFRPFVNKEMTK